MTSVGGSIVPFELTSMERVQNASALTTYTYANRDIGAIPETGQRWVFVCVHSRATSNGRTLNSVTVGGSSLTMRAQARFSGGGATLMCEIWGGLVTTVNTTADIVVVFSNTMAECAIAWYSCTFSDSKTLTIHDSATYQGADGLITLDALDNSFILAAARCASSTFTWSGVDNGVGTPVTSATRHLATGYRAYDAVTGQEISVSVTGSGTDTFTATRMGGISFHLV